MPYGDYVLHVMFPVKADFCRNGFGSVDSVTTYSCTYPNDENDPWGQAGEQNALLQCDQGLVIRVNSATFGKPTMDQCLTNDPQYHDDTCGSTADLTADAKAKCDGEESCTYQGTSNIAGDPCYGVHKHTAIEYSCVSN